MIKSSLPEKANCSVFHDPQRKQKILRILMNNHSPLPEKSISPHFGVIKVSNFSTSTMNVEHAALQLGLPFIGEMYSRLIHSKRKQDGTYYCYAEQLINNAKALSVLKGINGIEENLHKNQLICKNICDYITWPKHKLKDDGLIKIIDCRILLAMQHPIIHDCYKVTEIQTINLRKSKNANHFRGLKIMILYYYHYSKKIKMCPAEIINRYHTIIILVDRVSNSIQ